MAMQRQPSFTIDAAQIEKAVLEKAGDKAPVIERVVAAGMKLLFSKETHNKFFDAIRPNVPLEDELGAGAFHVMMILYKESNGTMPPYAFIPAGTILLAKACEFIAKTKMFPITDKTFYDALEMFDVVTKRAAHENEKKQTQPAATPMPAQSAPQPGGMLQGG